MEIWLKGRKKIRIPVLPSEYTVTSEQHTTVINIYALGDIALKGKRGLREVSFSSFFPFRDDAGYVDVSNLKTPKYYVEQIEKMKQKGKLKLMITQSPVNFYSTITSFEWGERDGTGDIYYTITFQEYRSVSASASSVVVDSGASAGPGGGAEGTGESGGTREAPEASVQTYEVKGGDTLSAIARKLTGSSDYSAIYAQNKGVIGSNPNNIQIGMVLTIPAG